MTLAIEYIIRTGVLKKNIVLPISIFVEHKRWNDKVAITISKKTDRLCSVKHWALSKCHKQYLPDFKEFIVNYDDLFTSTYTILENYYLIEFLQPNFPYGRKQFAEPPYSLIQSHEYESYIQTFYNPAKHKIKRLNWLWESFTDAHKSEFINQKILNSSNCNYYSIFEMMDTQREQTRKDYKKLWANWIMWRKYMLDFPADIAPELIFKKDYDIKNKLKLENNYNELSLWSL